MADVLLPFMALSNSWPLATASLRVDNNVNDAQWLRTADVDQSIRRLICNTRLD